MHQITTPADTVRRPIGLRRAVALSAVLAFGLLAPRAAGAAVGQPGPDDLTTDPGCEPDLGPCDIDPDECDPQTEICDFTSGGDGPDDPCEGDDPPEDCDTGGGDPGGEPEVEVEVDEPVRAVPTFTG